MEKNPKQLRMSQNERASEDPEVLEEEEKMEKFYELIRRFNEARRGYHQRLKSHLHQHQLDEIKEEGDVEKTSVVKDHTKKVKVEEDDDHAGYKKDCTMMASWMPSFKWEDFEDEFDDQAHHDMKKKRKIHALDDDHDHGDYSKDRCPQNGLDLNLAL